MMARMNMYLWIKSIVCGKFRTRARYLLLSLVFLAAGSTAWSLPVDGIYSAEVAVNNQADAERRRAYREALQQVFVKVTGEQRWLQHPRITAAVSNAESFVAEVGYRSTGMDAWIDVRFDRQQIDGLLYEVDIPVWDRNRASVLLWVTVQTADGRREMLGSSSDHELLSQARRFSAQRAVPVLIPLLDLTDRRMVSAEQSWALDVEALRAVGQRYGADSVLAGRMLVTDSGDVVGFWQFLFRDQVHVFDHVNNDLQAYMGYPLDQVAVRLANHFGLVLSEFEREDEVSVVVEGVRDLASHMVLIRYLESLSVVRDVRVTALKGESLELHLRLAGTRLHLTEFISLDRDLMPVNFELGSVDTDVLHYRWTR
jgi:uncharacterized protein